MFVPDVRGPATFALTDCRQRKGGGEIRERRRRRKTEIAVPQDLAGL
jgi:hypothetical protein